MNRIRLSYCIAWLALSPTGLGAETGLGKIQDVTYGKHSAFRLYTEKLEAIVVPDLGRIMSFKTRSGVNVLWNNDAPGSPYPNWGGDKVFIGPQFLWSLFGPSEWPPRPEWDGLPHKAAILPGGQLQLTSAAWPDFNAFFVRTFSFDSTGNFVIVTTLHRTGKNPLPIFVWPVTQVKKPDEIFLPLNPSSAYRNGYFFLSDPAPDAVSIVSPKIARIEPVDSSTFKIGVDSLVASVAARFGNEAFVMSAEKKNEQYPDGAIGAGFPVELYNQGVTGLGHYVELELISPVKWMRDGDIIEHTVNWKIVEVQRGSLSSAQVGALLQN